MGNDKKYTENYDEVTAEGFNYDSWNGGSGVGSKSNIEKLAEDYVNSSYDKFTQGTDYASLAKRYSTQGRRAMDDTLGMAAARTGGLASSYAVAAGNQAYNSHMEKLEDAARALYDSQMTEKANKLTVAQGLYDRQYGEWQDGRNFAYGQYSDKVSGAQWKDTTLTNQSNIDREWNYQLATDEEEKLYNQLYANNGGMTYEEYKAANPSSTMTEGTFNQILSTATGAYAEDNKEWNYQLATAEQADARAQAEVQFSQGIFPETEEEIAALMEATGWDAATITAYQTYYEDLASGEAAADATEESLEADSVLMDLLGSGMTWKEIKNNDKYTGYVESSTFGEDYWTNMEDMIAEENTVNDYTYAKTEEGAENIVNMLINGASTTLNNEDIGNFDYIFGEGAYDAVQTFVRSMDPDDLNSGFKVTQDMNPELFEDFFNSRVDALTAAVPGLSYEQILDIIEKVNPNAYRAATDDTWLKYSSYEEWKNTPAG